MNDEGSFETQLKRQPQRQIPAAWRREILQAARLSAPTPEPMPAKASWLAKLFWPHPVAWAALAAVWVVVIGLALDARDATPPVAVAYVAVPSPQVREMLRQQERLFAELSDSLERAQPAPSAPRPPQPRSQRREDMAMV